MLIGLFGGSAAVAAGGLALGGVPLPASATVLTTLIGFYLLILTVIYIARKPSPADSVERVLYRHSLQWQGRFLILEDFDHDARNLLGRVQRAIDFIESWRRARSANQTPSLNWLRIRCAIRS
ncbi:hypothetical protein [Streptosporangium sp. NPDC049644]|uniref:hypothetical protein n=1 Tax=Streptosporangium sp. NPDC049644 TaxID=3155507 RepID=UPI003432533C